jgi:hypothetical protein
VVVTTVRARSVPSGERQRARGRVWLASDSACGTDELVELAREVCALCWDVAAGPAMASTCARVLFVAGITDAVSVRERASGWSTKLDPASHGLRAPNTRRGRHGARGKDALGRGVKRGGARRASAK